MSDQAPRHLFAVLHGKQEIRRLPLQQGLQSAVGALFDSQEHSFRSPDAEVLDFDPSLRPDEGQIIRIGDFTVPEAVAAAISDPLSVGPLVFSAEAADRVAGLFVGRASPQPKILFQAFSRRQMLTTAGFSIILSHDTFRRLEEPGIVLDSRLCATIVGADLFLRSYTQAAKVLDLTQYYREATDDELSNFVAHDRLHCDDAEGMKAVSDTWVRRTVAVLLKSGIMDHVSARKARDVAASFKVDISIKKIGGKEKIVLPVDRAALKNVLRVLNDDYYLSPLTDNRYLSHSKQRLAAQGGQ